MIQRFYNALNNENLQEDEMANLLYSHDPNTHNLQKLKGAMKEKLIKTIFFINTGQTKGKIREHIVLKCYRNLAMCSILKKAHARFSIKTIAKDVFKKASFYELYRSRLI